MILGAGIYLTKSFCPAVRYNLLCHPEVSGLAQQDFRCHQGYKNRVSIQLVTKPEHLAIRRYKTKGRKLIGSKTETPNRFQKPVRCLKPVRYLQLIKNKNSRHIQRSRDLANELYVVLLDLF